MDINVRGALAMGRKNFIASHLRLKPIKDMVNGEQYLNTLYDEFERTERENTSVKSEKSVRKARKR